MFLSTPHVVGALLSFEIPLRSGPLKNGQLSAQAKVEIRITASAMIDART
jgi:hypothetical protein